MNNRRELLKFASLLEKLAIVTYSELGSGFKEDTFQKALSICFRLHKVDYFKETNIEIFFRNESLGVFRLDFLIPPQKHKSFVLKNAVIIETKVSASIKNPARLQLKNYLESLPKNKSEIFKNVSEGFVLNWHDGADAEEISRNGVDLELWKLNKKKFSEISIK